MLSDEQIEAIALEHEAFGFGRADERGLTTHGFDHNGLRAFVRAIEASLSQSTEQGERDAAHREHRELMLLAAHDLESWMQSHGRDGATEGTVQKLKAAAMSPHGDGVNYTRAEGGEDGAARLRFDVLQEIAQTFGLDYNAVCRCANAYLAGVPGTPQPDKRKPWEKTSWTCALARVDHEGMHCPENKCADCPNGVGGTDGR